MDNTIKLENNGNNNKNNIDTNQNNEILIEKGNFTTKNIKNSKKIRSFFSMKNNEIPKEFIYFKKNEIYLQFIKEINNIYEPLYIVILPIICILIMIINPIICISLALLIKTYIPIIILFLIFVSIILVKILVIEKYNKNRDKLLEKYIMNFNKELFGLNIPIVVSIKYIPSHDLLITYPTYLNDEISIESSSSITSTSLSQDSSIDSCGGKPENTIISINSLEITATPSNDNSNGTGENIV